MVVGRKWVLKHHFSGAPKESDFELVEEELPELKEGEILFRSLFISVDPYQRPYTDRLPVPMTMIGSSVAEVEKSKNKEYPQGSKIVIYGGWVERGVTNPKPVHMPGHSKPAPPYIIPPLPVSPSLMLGALGMPGCTAYFGFLELCQPKSGETVVVSGAAGAVGSMVGQIAKIKGCKTIGFAGSDDKVAYLKELGYDHAFNYKKTAVEAALKEAAPNGVHCYFDNVGGEMSLAVMNNMVSRGRVAVCGAISQYNKMGSLSNSNDVFPTIVGKELKVEGFLVSRWRDQSQEAVKALADWVLSKKIKTRETVMEGFENIPKAFMGLFDGTNTGKMVVKI